MTSTPAFAFSYYFDCSRNVLRKFLKLYNFISSLFLIRFSLIFTVLFEIFIFSIELI